MFKLFNKLLARSNSYNYYKSNYEVIKSQSNSYKEENNELKSKLDILSSDLDSLQNSLKNIQNEFQGNYQSLINEIQVNRILQNVESIKRDSKNGRSINIVFITNFRNAVMDKLLNLFKKDPLFHPVVLVIPYDLHGLNIFEKGLDEHQLNEYEDNYQYFKKIGFEVVKGYDIEQKTLIDIELELRPDIIFYHTPWDTTFPEEFKIKNLPKNILFCYIPYGIHASYIVDGQFNRELHKKAWKIFHPTLIHKKLAMKYSHVGSSNVVVTGHPKMDPLLDGSHENCPYPWKDSNHHKKRIIWAPHHSIKWGICFSTFHKNYKFFLEFAKNHSEIEWVFKPHPNLRHYYLIASSTFPEDDRFNNENLDKYYSKWAKLDNATIYERGDYHNMFATSDAMITDSVSFLSEYLYSGNPGLFLNSPTQNFNEYGDIIKDAWYQADGNDFNEIENFVNNVINEEDPLKNAREEIYNKYLKTNGVNASENIYNYIKGSIK